MGAAALKTEMDGAPRSRDNPVRADEATRALEKTQSAACARLKAWRTWRGLSQDGFARACGVSVVTIKKAEGGERPVTMWLAVRAALVCGVDAEMLLFRDPPAPRKD